MKHTYKEITINNSTFETEVLEFDESDKQELYSIYLAWRQLSASLKKMNSRTINLPEGLSESAFCLAMENTVRVCGSLKQTTNSNRQATKQEISCSFDCFNLQTNERIQVKSCSVLPDLTSFGPHSVWDKLYFVDFFRTGNWDGSFDIYLIPNKDIYEHKVNSEETFRDQQGQGRRPRFSIYSDIILPQKLKPIKTFSLKP